MLAAGRGTRLGALGTRLPKPLVPVCGHPPIAFGLALCRQHGLRDVVVNLHHHGDAVRAVVGDGAGFGLAVRYSDETELLGTGGGLVAARSLFSSEPVLVMNAKVIANLDLGAVLAAHRERKRQTPALVATMVVRPMPVDATFAPVEVDAGGRVTSLRGSVVPEGPVRRCMFTGVHVIEGALLDRLPLRGESDVIASAYLPALADGAHVAAFEMTGYFEEHSTPARYLAGNLALLRRPDLIDVAPGELVGVDAGAVIHEDARIVAPVRIQAGAIIESDTVVGPEVVVGTGATVLAGARVTRAVVWPGARVGGTVADTTIVT